MTGCVFAQAMQACSHLGIKFEINSSTIDFARDDKLQHYINLLYPSWNNGTAINLSTGVESPELGYHRKYPTIVFPNIALIWGFLSKLRPNDMKDCISKVFSTDSITPVYFLDTTAALIQFSKEEFVNVFLIVKDTLERDDGVIAVLHPLAKLLEGGNTCAASYETYKDICSAPVSRVLFADQAEAMGIMWKTKVEPASAETHELPSTAENSNLFSVVKQRNEREIDQDRSHNQVSCEDILGLLSASKPLYGKRVISWTGNSFG